MSDETPARRATDLPPNSPWWAFWLVANIEESWKWASLWWPGVCAALAEAYAANPAEINAWVQANVPANWWPHLVALGCAVQILLRVVKVPLKP